MHLASLKSSPKPPHLNPPLTLLIFIFNHSSSIQRSLVSIQNSTTNLEQRVHQSSDFLHANCHCYQLREQTTKKLTLTSQCRKSQKNKSLEMSCLSQYMPLGHICNHSHFNLTTPLQLPSHSKIKKLQIFSRLFLPSLITSFNYVGVSAHGFIGFNIVLPTNITNKQIWPFLACLKKLLFAWFLHRTQVFSYNINLCLFLLHLFYIPDNSFMHFSNQFHFSNCLFYLIFHYNNLINFLCQHAQVIVHHKLGDITI